MRTRPGALAEVGQVVGEHAERRCFGVEVLARAERLRPAGRRWCRSASAVVAGARLDLRLGLGRLGLRLLDAAPEGLAQLGQRLGSAPHHDDDEDDDEDEQRSGMGGWYSARWLARSIGRWRGLRSERDGDDEAQGRVGRARTTRPCCRPGRRPSRRRGGRRSAGWPPFPCARRPRSRRSVGSAWPASSSGASSAGVSAPSRTTSVSGSGRALGQVGRPLGDEPPDLRVVDVDQGDAHPRPDPELVEQGRGVDAFHGRYRAMRCCWSTDLAPPRTTSGPGIR